MAITYPSAGEVALSAVNPTLLPPTITGPIFEKTEESSAVMRLARRVPLALNAETAVPIPGDVPLAGWVVEGGQKPLSKSNVGVKTISGKKVAVLIPVSEEVVRTNSGALYSQLQSDLPVAIGRAFDHAAIHGKDLASGAAGPFADYLANTTNTIELGTSSQATGGMYRDLVNGEILIAESAGYEFTGFVADPLLRPTLKLQVDTLGRPVWVDAPQNGLQAGTLIGYDAYYNKGVRGKLYRQATTTDSGLRAIGGDFSQCAYGVGMDITIKVSTQASWQDTDGWHSAFQENVVLLLAEAYYGFAVNDNAAFVAYTDTVANS